MTDAGKPEDEDDMVARDALRREFDLEAWTPEAPRADFTEGVLARIRAEERAPEAPRSNPLLEIAARPEPARRRPMLILGVFASVAVAAGVLLFVGGHGPPEKGAAIAAERTEVAVGSRAKAVLEPGARVEWNGDDVVQSRGDVFYRVEPGKRFTVHTPAGDVEVLGTCFAVKVRGGSESLAMDKRDVKAAVVGAGISAMALVAVYEGKVAVTHAHERVELTSGEAAQASGSGIQRSTDPAATSAAFEAKAAAAAEGEPLVKANDNLVDQVRSYKQRLDAIESQKKSLEEQLKKTEAKLSAQSDGAAVRTRSEFDLDANDWAELAKKGVVKYRSPCPRKDMWNTPPEKLAKIGLAPQDAAVLREAYERSYERVWAQIRPLCAQALGANVDVVDKIGLDTCPHLIQDMAMAADKEAASAANTQVAEIRAGLRPEPGPNEKVNPVVKMFLALTGANKAFEADLAKSLGPEEAHRLAYSDDLCAGAHSWGSRR